jgi:hypothetical protein
MTQDAYWDDLGVAWTAISPKAEIAPHLKRRLRRQTLFTAAMLFTGLPLSLAGMALGVWTIWRGASAEAWFFVTRGIAILTISALLGIAAWSFRTAWKDNSQSLAAMIELALARAERWQRAIRLGYFALGIAILFGTVGYEIRLSVGKPPAMSPVEPLILLAVLGFVLFLLQGKAKNDIAKYSYLRQLLLEE